MRHINNLPASAPMPKSEEDIRNNSMKLYAYLITISGLADYPDNTRMFRQKNLILTQIKNSTGITDKTVKLYLYYLEENGLIEYQGENRFHFLRREKYDTFKDYRLDAIKYASEVWKKRQKDKMSVYYIPRPQPFTTVPEVTLKRLNEDFQVTETELELYLFLCKYRDECVKNHWKYKVMTYEQIRDILELKKHAETDHNIFTALCFLQKVGLIKFTIGYTANSKLAKIPCFKITDVGYYITEPIVNFETEELMNEEEVAILKEVNKRVRIGYEKMKAIKQKE